MSYPFRVGEKKQAQGALALLDAHAVGGGASARRQTVKQEQDRQPLEHPLSDLMGRGERVCGVKKQTDQRAKHRDCESRAIGRAPTRGHTQLAFYNGQKGHVPGRPHLRTHALDCQRSLQYRIRRNGASGRYVRIPGRFGLSAGAGRAMMAGHWFEVEKTPAWSEH